MLFDAILCLLCGFEARRERSFELNFWLASHSPPQKQRMISLFSRDNELLSHVVTISSSFSGTPNDRFLLGPYDITAPVSVEYPVREANVGQTFLRRRERLKFSRWLFHLPRILGIFFLTSLLDFQKLGLPHFTLRIWLLSKKGPLKFPFSPIVTERGIWKFYVFLNFWRAVK